VFSFSCCIAKDNINLKIKDNDNASEWINRVVVPSSSIEIFQGERVVFSIIPEILKSEFIIRLEYEKYIELEADEYFKITEKQLNQKHGLAVRAVYTHLGGDFSVKKNDKNEYYVHYLALGSRVWELNKTVLIIQTDELPIEIFNGYTVAK